MLFLQMVLLLIVMVVRWLSIGAQLALLPGDKFRVGGAQQHVHVLCER